MTTTVDYKHRATFVFKGITWKYDKHYGEWRPPKKYNEYPTIFSTSFPATGWNADGQFGTTPEQALRAWTRNYVKTVTSNHKRLAKQLIETKATLKRLKAESWL